MNIMKETEERPGVESNMRKTVVSIRRAAWVAILYGVSLSFAILAKGGDAYQLVPVVGISIGAGFGAILGGAGFKALQAKYEAQVNAQ